MIRTSTLLLLFAAVLLFIGGLIYLTLPITPQHEYIIGMSALELSFYNPYIYTLTTSLVNIIGTNLFVLSLLFVYIGFKAWQDKFAWFIGLLSLLFYALPIALAASRSTSPLPIVIAPLVPILFGLILAATMDREWSKAEKV